ncbi:hypothetical protein CFC21_026230 [Triticum aestivum]|uniref:Disease resistance protein At4g27190-like leucine-rich repeats domain-containing protein n=2 Tax=Triticum aestivum TaxID=4565 RepID=A0A9R1EK59_WHEAT|nr:uncharacterized protein LOC123042576 [Triticum aestivum]KAF7011988.1 hypothetical protein CFC21_026230 [Triticum aestivum]
MPHKIAWAHDVGEAAGILMYCLEDTTSAAHRTIYFDGWLGLAASATLRAVAQHPQPSLQNKFNKIIHLDCSRWISRRALQRAIAEELKLPPSVMAIFDMQDEIDDFSGIDGSSRAEIGDVSREIHRAMQEHRCLIVFHNGSDNTIDLNDLGIPRPGWFDTRILWSFRGRLRTNLGIKQKVDNSHLFLDTDCDKCPPDWDSCIREEAREIAQCTCRPAVTTKIAEECCLYLLSLSSRGGNIMHYNWATHASSYWVCDGIIQGDEADEAWEVADSLRQQIRVEHYSSHVFSSFGNELKIPPNRWVLARDNSVVQGRTSINTVSVHPDSTSLFVEAVTSESDPPLRLLPNDMFHQSDNLHVLKLCHCTFSFSSPPFHCCQNLRFLGLDNCKDQRIKEDEEQDRSSMKFFQSLWVLDICCTNWELALSPEIIEQMEANIREVHIHRGRIWRLNFAWRQLQNLRKLKVTQPTSPWESSKMDEFTDMVKLEFLDLSGNSTIQILPSLSGATSLKTMVLVGCFGLEHVGPEGLPPSLESFRLDAGPKEDHGKKANITRVSMAGCARLFDFTLGGSLPMLEELNLSGTSVKTLDLRDEVVQVHCLQKIMLLKCEKLHAILWPEKGITELALLCIDTRGGEEIGRIPSKFYKANKGHCEAHVAIVDMRFIQLLVLRSWNVRRMDLNLCISATSTDGRRSCNKGPGNSGKIIAPPQPKPLITNISYNTYTDLATENIFADHFNGSACRFEPFGCHVEIGDGINNTSVESVQGVKAVIFVMNKVESLNVHDNSSITTIIPKHMVAIDGDILIWQRLKWCHVVRCPKMHTVFTSDYNSFVFEELEKFWAADLLMVHCIWSKGKTVQGFVAPSFAKLRSIHLYACPSLTFVLSLAWFTLSSLETLHIVNCGNLNKVFPVEPEFLTRIDTNHQKGALEFPKLKHIYLHELYKLQHICEAKMIAPILETIRLRGCWGLERLPAVGLDRRPIVDCEKEWWEKLEWDGLEAQHDPSLFEPHHPPYYKEPLPRGSVLW